MSVLMKEMKKVYILREDNILRRRIIKLNSFNDNPICMIFKNLNKDINKVFANEFPFVLYFYFPFCDINKYNRSNTLWRVVLK